MSNVKSFDANSTEKIIIPPTLDAKTWSGIWYEVFSDSLEQLNALPPDDLVNAFALSQSLFFSLEQRHLFSLHLSFDAFLDDSEQISVEQALFIYYLVKLSQVPTIRSIYLKPYEQYRELFFQQASTEQNLSCFNSFSDLIYLGFNLSEMYISFQKPLFATWEHIVYLVEQFRAEQERALLQEALASPKNTEHPSVAAFL